MILSLIIRSLDLMSRRRSCPGQAGGRPARAGGARYNHRCDEPLPGAGGAGAAALCMKAARAMMMEAAARANNDLVLEVLEVLEVHEAVHARARGAGRAGSCMRGGDRDRNHGHDADAEHDPLNDAPRVPGANAHRRRRRNGGLNEQPSQRMLKENPRSLGLMPAASTPSMKVLVQPEDAEGGAGRAGRAAASRHISP